MDDIRKDETASVIERNERKKEKLLYTSIILVTVIFLTLAYLLVPDVFGDRKTTSSKIRQMTKLTSKIGKLETEAREKWGYILNLIDEYSQKTGETLPALDGLGLSDEEKRLLNERIGNSRDVSFQSLLRDILSKEKEISEIQKEIKDYEALLPAPRIVKEGENHYEIAMDFLINEKGIVKEKAMRLVERTALFDELRAGFKVWNFYSGDEYGTFVTQGDALISPGEVSKEAKKRLIDTIDRAILEKEKLASNMENLEKASAIASSEAEEFRIENEQLKLENKKLSETIDIRNKKIREMEESLNSLWYMVETERNLFRRGILGRRTFGPKKLEKMPSEDNFKSIDLRENTTIEIYAKDFNLNRIREITLYPGFYNSDQDYGIEIDESKQKAVLAILAVGKFKTGRVIISVK